MSTGSANRVLVVDDDPIIIGEYVRCLSRDFEPGNATVTLGDLEKALFGEESNEAGTISFDVHSRNQGEAAVEAVCSALAENRPYAIVFLDMRMPPGIDGVEAAKQIRALDENINIVVMTGSVSPEPENLGQDIPPADKLFLFKKPFHALECRQLAAALCGKWHSDRALRRANEELEKRVEERTAALQKIAYFDPVTRLPNKYLLIEELKVMVEKAEDSPGDSVVILLDVDGFSSINETMGYEAGTELLRSIGNRLSRKFGDEANHRRAIVGRFGSDEFALLAPAVASEDDISALTESVRQCVESPFLIDGRDLFLTASIGVAWHPVHGRDAKSVFQCAEAALHRSMRSPVIRVTYYHNEMRFRARHKFDLQRELRDAIESGQIVPHYQPQQCTESGAVAGLEALARWKRPDGTTVPPSDFVPLSEEMGISDVLFRSLLQDVCHDVALWRKRGDWQIPISINLSAHQLRNRELVDVVTGIIKAEGIEASVINLELTETVLLEDLTVAQSVLEDFSKAGVGIHIDDFGPGYSSLSYLAQLPVQSLKIDQSFVSQLSESNANNRVVEAIVALGKAMQLDVVAEGVETDQQYAIVRRLGVDLVQGFFIAKPMPADELLTWLDGYEDTQSIKKRSAIVEIGRD